MSFRRITWMVLFKSTKTEYDIRTGGDQSARLDLSLYNAWADACTRDSQKSGTCHWAFQPRVYPQQQHCRHRYLSAHTQLRLVQSRSVHQLLGEVEKHRLGSRWQAWRLRPRVATSTGWGSSINPIGTMPIRVQSGAKQELGQRMAN